MNTGKTLLMDFLPWMTFARNVARYGGCPQAPQRFDYNLSNPGRQNHLSDAGLSLFLPGGCPNDRDHRNVFPSCDHPVRAYDG